jgi:PmbA protein
VTELLGSGVNIVNGDYSRGAAGLWIEKGRLAWSVNEVTVSGNLASLWTGIEAVACELEFLGSVASPAILIGEMRVSGT